MSCCLSSLTSNPLVPFRAFSALSFARYASWGVAPGCYISAFGALKQSSPNVEPSMLLPEFSRAILFGVILILDGVRLLVNGSCKVLRIRLPSSAPVIIPQ